MDEQGEPLNEETPELDPVEPDEPDDGPDTPTGEVPTDTPTGTAAKGTRVRDLVRDKGLIRRAATKATTLQGVPAAHLTLLAGLYGVDATPVDVTVAILTTDKSALTALTDITAIGDADPFTASVVALEAGRGRMRAVHAALIAAGAVDVPAALNPSDAKAAVTIAQAVHKLEKGAKANLTAVAALAKRT